MIKTKYPPHRSKNVKGVRLFNLFVTHEQYLWIYDLAHARKKSLADIVRMCIVHVQNCANAPYNKITTRKTVLDADPEENRSVLVGEDK